MLAAGTANAAGCSADGARLGVLEGILKAWAVQCGYALCGRVIATTGDDDRCPDRPLAALAQRIEGADVAVVGEVHDNARHHEFRAGLLGLAKPGGAAVFEQMRADQAAALATFRALRKSVPASGDVAELKRLLDWDKSGWSKDGYDPLLQAVVGGDVPILAGDPARGDIKKVAKEGAAALAEDERKRLGLDGPLTAALEEGLLDDLEKSHCGLMPKTAFGNLAFAQRFRDATQADAALRAAREHGAAMLFVGNGHVRKDRGVPYYLKKRAPDQRVVSVMLIEVEEGKNDPEAYFERGPDGQPTADYIVFTPRAERADPCEEMRAHMQRKASGGGKP